MAGWTNKGKYRAMGVFCRAEGDTQFTNGFYVALCTSATSPTADINTMSELTEIAAGNGYTSGGVLTTRSSAGFDVWTEDDGNDRCYVQLIDIVWTASGGNIPASGNGARWAVMIDKNGTIGSREVFIYWDLTSDRTISSGQTLTLQNCEIRLNET